MLLPAVASPVRAAILWAQRFAMWIQVVLVTAGIAAK